MSVHLLRSAICNLIMYDNPLLFLLCLFLCSRYYRLVCCYSQSYLALYVRVSRCCWWVGWI